MHAYRDLYVEDAICNLSELFDIGINECGWDPDEFAMLFVQSGVAELFGTGNPRYLAGMSGYELAEEVFDYLLAPPVIPMCGAKWDRSHEYWAGSYLAEYQWNTGRSFMDIFSVIPLSEIIDMYNPYHEMDIEHFTAALNSRIEEESVTEPRSALKQARERRGMSQSELALAADVKLRNIQLYEQGVNDINKAHAAVVLRLAKALCCNVETLITG